MEQHGKTKVHMRYWIFKNLRYHKFHSYLALTQMEPLYARMVFPCFDEPAMKATFQINIYHESRFDALSNMPIAQRGER